MKRASNEFMLEACDLIITETADCAEYLHQTNRTNSDEICFLLFDRMFQGLSSFRILMALEGERKIVYNGAVIIMRSLLSDCVYGYEINDILNSEIPLELKIEKLNELFHKALIDGHIHSLKYFDRLESDKKISVEELNIVKSTIGEKIKVINPELTVDKLKNMKRVLISTWLKEKAKVNPIFDRIENNYKTFSQVEHFSGFYANWLNFDLDKKFEMLMESIFLCGHHIAFLTDFLSIQVERKDFFKERFHQFQDQLNAMVTKYNEYSI